MSGSAPGDATFCADLVRSHDFSRYAATLFVSPAERRALLALYAFNVEIVRVRDQVTQPLPGEIRLQWWTDLLSGHADGSAEGNPVAAELLAAIREHELPVEPLSRLIDEHQFDLYNDPMPTMAALEGYLGNTSSAIFGLAARIAGPFTASIDHAARHAGLAQGIVQVVTALPRDASRRQLFVPQQLLDARGSTVDEVFAGRETSGMRAAIDELLGDARKHLATATSLLSDLPGSSRRAFLPLALVDRDLARLSRSDRNLYVMEPRSRLRTLWTLWRASRSRTYTD